MAEIVYSARAVGHFERALDLPAVAEEITSAVNILATHPLVGRRIAEDLRELVISFGDTGFIALYRFVVQENRVRILAFRHQREIGYLP